jgi:hypothetical protein
MANGCTRLAEETLSETSSSADLCPSWARWIIPSAVDVMFIAILSLLAFTTLSARLLGDAGIGWHIRTGQLILATHSIPRVDPFSATAPSTAPAQPAPARGWFAWEWLYDVLAGFLDAAAGLNGVVLFTALVIAAVFSSTFWLLLRRGTNILLALILVMLAESASMIHCLARPHVMSWLFTVAWFCILESSETDRRRQVLWLLPLLMLVWVNVHGGFLVGFVLLAIYWCSAVWQWWRLKDDSFNDALRRIEIGRRIRTLTLTGILSGLATLANPYGFHLHVHIYHYLSDRFLMDHIEEFQSPDFHYVAQKCFAALLLLTLVALAGKKRKVEVSQGLVVLFAVYSGLYATRNIPVSSLLLVLVIAPWLSEAWEKFAHRRHAKARNAAVEMPFLQRMQAMELGLRGHLWPIAAAVLACWIAMHGGKLGTKSLMDSHFNAKRFPVAAVNYLEKENAPGPFVSLDSWGGYLIYRLYPRVRMVVDDRHDFYGDEFVKSYLKMVRVEPGWQDFLDQHPARSVLVPKDSALANILGETPSWHAVYSDDVAIAFVPTPRTPE